jgi:hypothetical protein
MSLFLLCASPVLYVAIIMYYNILHARLHEHIIILVWDRFLHTLSQVNIHVGQMSTHMIHVDVGHFCGIDVNTHTEGNAHV